MFSKNISGLGEVMQIKVTDQEIAEEENTAVKFETFHYDDFIQIDIF